MASLTISIETEATGPQGIVHELSEDAIQRIFAMLVATNPDMKLGDILRARVDGFVSGLLVELRAYEDKRDLAAAVAAREEIEIVAKVL